MKQPRANKLLPDIKEVEVGEPPVIKGVGELRYNTFTSTRINACFLVGIGISYIHISFLSTPKTHHLATKTNKNTKNIKIYMNSY